jgi:hypothetical protein
MTPTQRRDTRNLALHGEQPGQARAAVVHRHAITLRAISRRLADVERAVQLRTMHDVLTRLAVLDALQDERISRAAWIRKRNASILMGRRW